MDQIKQIRETDKTDNNDITKLEDLNGMTFANSAGSSYEALGVSYGATNNTIDTFADTMSMIFPFAFE